MATFSGGKALLRTDKIFIRTRTQNGTNSSSDAGGLLYSISENEYAIMKIYYLAVGGYSSADLQVFAYAKEDYIADTNNETTPTAARRRLDLAAVDFDLGFGTTGGVAWNPTETTKYLIPSGADIRYKFWFTGGQPNDAWGVLWADVEVYSINNIIDIN